MLQLLRAIKTDTGVHTELLQTHTRLLAAIANASNPVEHVSGN
jgi:hypothetical protein